MRSGRRAPDHYSFWQVTQVDSAKPIDPKKLAREENAPGTNSPHKFALDPTAVVPENPKASNPFPSSSPPASSPEEGSPSPKTGRPRKHSGLLPHRRPTLLGTLISSICHLIILSLFFWALRLGSTTVEMQPVFEKTPTLWNMLSLLGGWSQFWLVSVALATFTIVSWPFHGFFMKLLGLLPLLYGISRQLA